jgi:hypothetical protein
MDSVTLVFSVAIVVLFYLVVIDSKRVSVANNESKNTTPPECLSLDKFRYLNKPLQGPGSMTDNIGVPPSAGVMQGVIRRLGDVRDI